MWLCTKLGFFSIVKKGRQGEWQVRARVKEDLNNLISATCLKAEIIHTPKADYACRIVVKGDELAAIFSAFANSIEYSNFKDEIARQSGQRAKLGAYHAFWHEMLLFQEKG